MKKQKNAFVFPRILKHYYLVFKLDHFRQFRMKAMKQLGSYENNFLNFVEGSLFMYLYRSNFITNLFMIKSVMELGVFLVNNKRRYHTHYYTTPGDIITVLQSYFYLVKDDLLLRLDKDMIVRPTPRYMEINFKFLCIFCTRKPNIFDLSLHYTSNDVDVFVGVDFCGKPKIS